MIEWALFHDFLLEFYWLAHIGVALAVTSHVLLNKKDVRSSAGWIALAWLSPFLVSALYFVIGINRIARRGARIHRELDKSHDQTRIDYADPHVGFLAGNNVRCLRSGFKAYAEMLAAIEAADFSVALSSYIFRADKVGLQFIEALAGAKSRGVEVRILLDGVGSGYFYSPAFRLLRKQGIPAARFLHSWLPWHTSYLNLRNHKKLLVVDGKVGFTGGRNIGAENLATPDSYPFVKDLHFRIEGPVVRQLMQSFEQDWTFTTRERLDGEEWWPALAPSGTVQARGISSGPDEEIESLFLVLATLIGHARERIRIVTPYFLPDDELAMLIYVAAKRGVTIEIVVPEKPNHSIVKWAVRAQLSAYNAGYRIFLSPLPFDHSKLVTIDGAHVIFGSANWDARSLRLNFEFNVECFDEMLAAQLDSIIDEKIASSSPFQADRSALIRMRNAVARLFLPYL